MALDATSHDFLQALLDNANRDGTSQADVDYIVERLVPVLMPGVCIEMDGSLAGLALTIQFAGIEHLLRAVATNRQRAHDGDEDEAQINPLNHLAKYLLRHNPRFNEPVGQASSTSLETGGKLTCETDSGGRHGAAAGAGPQDDPQVDPPASNITRCI